MFQHITPITKNIMIINVVVYILSNIFISLYSILPAYYPFSPNFQSWQVITHMFMHAPLQSGSGLGLMHILFNMLTLMSFGPVLEMYLKEKRYLVLYFASGLGAFLLFNIWNIYEVNQLVSDFNSVGGNTAEIFAKSSFGYGKDIPISANSNEGLEIGKKLISTIQTPMVGASGAIFGVVAAFSTLFPDAKLSFMFIPYPIKAKYLFPIIVAVSIYLGFSGNMSGVAHFAHVGGAIVGFLLAKYWNKNKFRIR